MKYICVLLIALAALQVRAQKSFTLSTDPLTVVALGGFEVEAGLSFKKNRITTSYLQGDLTPWYSQAGDFKSTSHRVIEFGYGRWLKEEQKGFNYGLAFTQFTEFKVENEAGESLEKHPTKLGVRLAYAWFPIKKIDLFIEPVMTFGVMLRDKDLDFASGETFDKKLFIGNGPVVNVGYKFSF